MHMPKAITTVAHWLGAGDFDRLSPDERRAAWFYALATHLPLVPVTYIIVHLSPALRPTAGNYLLVHFLIALLLADVATGISGLWELLLREKPPYERSGWVFAFAVTLQPLLVASFLGWLF